MRRTYTRYEPPPPPARRFGLAEFFAWTLVAVLGVVVMAAVLPDVLVSYGIVSPERMRAVLYTSPAQGTPLPSPQPTAPRQTGGQGSQPGGALPSCAVVTDTRTACQPVAEEEQAQPQTLPTEPPAPTATPAYMTACWTEPGQRPCWLPPDAPWRPLADVPATPLVAVEEAWHAPLALPADVCADWRPPAPWPEECG